MKRKAKKPNHSHKQVPCKRAMTALLQHLKDAVALAEQGKIQEALQLAIKFGLETGRYRSMNRDLIRRAEAGELFKIKVQPKAVAKKKELAKTRHENLNSAVIDLLENGGGHRMTNAEIAKFLHDRDLSPYKPTSTLRYVSTIVARERKKNKTS